VFIDCSSSKEVTYRANLFGFDDREFYILMKFWVPNFSSNTIWSIAGGGVPALAALGAIPALIKLLGVDLFALVSLILSLNLFFFVYDFGLTRSMHFFSPKSEYQQQDKVGQLIGSSILLAVFIASVVTLIIVLISPLFSTNWLKLTGKDASEVALAFQLAALGIIPAVISNVFKGVFEGKIQFKTANMAKMFSGFSLFVTPVVVAIFTSSLVIISISIMLTRYISLMLYGYFLLRLAPIHTITLSNSILKKVVAYAFWAGISGFFATLFIYGDRFIVSGYVSASELSVYMASQDVLIRYLLIPWSIAIVLSPYFSNDNHKLEQLKIVYLKALNSSSFFTIIFVIFAIILVTFILPIWIDANFINLARQLNFILITGIVFAALSQLPLIFLYAQGKARLLTIIFIFEGVGYIILAPIIFEMFGIIGAACVWSARLMIEFTFLNYFSQKLLR